MTGVRANEEGVPHAAPALRFQRYQPEIDGAIQTCLKGGVLVGGPLVEKFERDMAEYLGVRHVVSCNSCTDALYLSLHALGIGPGDEVIVPSLTAGATGVAVVRTGATPRFCDVNRVTRNIDLASIKTAMSKRVRAIIVVHLHGIPADMNPILDFARRKGVPVIEDCAQAIGATYGDRRVGTFGAAGAFSFYPTKNLGCIGDGGAVATDSDELADSMKSVRNYGWNHDKDCIREGINSRLDALQAAVLSALLPHLDSGNSERIAAAQSYDAVLHGLNIVPPTGVQGAVYHQYAIEADERSGLVEHLSGQGIASAFHYDKGLHEEPYFKQFISDDMLFPNTEYLTKRLVSLPIQPELLIYQNRVTDALKSYKSK